MMYSSTYKMNVNETASRLQWLIWIVIPHVIAISLPQDTALHSMSVKMNQLTYYIRWTSAYISLRLRERDDTTAMVAMATAETEDDTRRELHIVSRHWLDWRLGSLLAGFLLSHLVVCCQSCFSSNDLIILRFKLNSLFQLGSVFAQMDW